MERILKALALGTVPVVGAFVCVLLLQLSSVATQMRRDEQSIALEAETALVTLNRTCGTVGKIQPCGTLAEVDKVLTHSSDLLVQSQKTVRDADRVALTESAMLPVWNQAFTQTLANVDATTATVGDSAKRLTDAAVPVMASADMAVEQMTVTEQHLDVLVQSPEVTESLKYVAASTKSIADATAQADVILADARLEADKYTHPPKKKLGFWGGVMAAGDVAKHFMPPIF